jgi:hypothetical protein
VYAVTAAKNTPLCARDKGARANDRPFACLSDAPRDRSTPQSSHRQLASSWHYPAIVPCGGMLSPGAQ